MKLGYINAIRSFYRLNKITVEGLNNVKIPAKASEKYLDLPVLTIEDVRKAILACGVDDILTRALILTFFSSGQAQAEVQQLQGRHLKNIVNDVTVVNMTRGKTNRRYTFLIGQEALTAIREYKPVIADDELLGPEISRMTGITKATVYAHINKLSQENIIKKVKKVGNTQLYQLNNDNPKAKIILMLERFIVSERFGKLIEKEGNGVVHKIINSVPATETEEMTSV